MASCQQQKLPRPPFPKPQEQTVVVRCKAYPGKTLGIEDDGSVNLVDKVEQWEKVGVEVKVEVIDGVEVEVEVFLLLNQNKDHALAHGKAGEKVFLVPFAEGVRESNMLWSQFANSDNDEFKPISSTRDLQDVGTHTYVNLDVNKSGENTEVVVNPPNDKDSQLWNISPALK